MLNGAGASRVRTASSLTGAATAAATATPSAMATATLSGASGAMASGGQPKEDQPFVRVQRGKWVTVGHDSG